MSWYAWLFAIVFVTCGFVGLGLAVVMYIEEDIMEKKYSAGVVNKAKDFGGDVEPEK